MIRRLSRLAGAAVVCVVAARPLFAMQQDSTDARIVIVVDSLDRTAFANVADLLQARVPGLYVARTGEGGLRWFMRGPSSTAESHPLVLVDDVRMNVAGSQTPEIGRRPPMLDEIDIEDVERIEIWSGAATSGRFGTGAGNGVIRIITADPRRGRTSFRIASALGLIDENVAYPSNFSRPGVYADGTTFRCTLQGEATEQCMPSGPLTSINVLEAESPFETALAARLAASLASGTEQLAWRGAATFDRQGSTAGTLASQRVHLRGSAVVQPTEVVNVSLRAFWSRSDADLLAPNFFGFGLLRQGLLAHADTTWTGFVRPSLSDYNAVRYGGAIQAQWRPRTWFDARITSGIAQMTDEDDLEYTVDFGEPFPPRQINERGERRRRDWNARIDAVARYGNGAFSHATGLIIEHAVDKEEDEHRAITRSSGDPVFSRAFWVNRRMATAGVGVVQRLRFWERGTLIGGVRLNQVRVHDFRWDVPAVHHASVTWDATPFGHGVWNRVQLRAALGAVPNVPQTIGATFLLSGGADRPKAEVTDEREIGFEAAILENRIGWSLTWYTKRTDNVGSFISGPPPSFPGFTHIEVLNRGIEGLVHARILRTPHFTWDAQAWYAYNHNEVTRGGSTPLVIGYDPFNQSAITTDQWIRQGSPLGAHRLVPIVSIQDLDGDGLIDDWCFQTSCEVVVGPSSEFHPAYPPRSASVATSLRFRAVTLRALLDHRSGHVMNNTTREMLCFRDCQALYDPSTPLREQAEAVMSSGRVFPPQDGSYTKLREVSLQLEAPLSWARALGTSRLNVSLAGRNVATWTDYPGLDPETTAMPWIPLVNEDNLAEPLPRRFSLRITATK